MPKQQTQTAKIWLDSDPLFLDTETTGLGPDSEIVEIAIVDRAGGSVFRTLVRPTAIIPAAATRIHGITQEMVCRIGIPMDVIWDQLYPIIKRRQLVIYNAAYDVRLIYQSCAAVGLDLDHGIFSTTTCAMLLYADYRGEWDDFHGNNRWHNLGAACAQQAIRTVGVQLHRAAGDAELTRRLLHVMAGLDWIYA